ncbi:unnamed protein product [Closterium sp. NIES-54]
MVHQVLQRFGFQFSSPQRTPLPTSHSLSAPPSDESIEPSGAFAWGSEGLGFESQCVYFGIPVRWGVRGPLAIPD